MNSSARNKGFTLVELLVVIAIIGILVALLLPAVQAAREAARRMQCSNRIKQVSLALQNYHDTHKRFPPAAIWGMPYPGIRLQKAYHHTWLVMILPFMEQNNLYDSIDMRRRIWGQAAVGKTVPFLRCPSDGDFLTTDRTHGIAVTNYSGSEGYHWWPNAVLTAGWWASRPPGYRYRVPDPYGDYSGLFTVTRTHSFADIKDGTSNSIVVAETNATGYKWGHIWTSDTGKRRLATGEGVFRSAFVATGVHGTCSAGLYSEVDDSGVKTPVWFRAGPHSFTPTYLAAWGPNAEWPGAGSSHPQIIQVGRADGGVDSINLNVHFPIWVMLNAINDHHVSSEPGDYPAIP